MLQCTLMSKGSLGSHHAVMYQVVTMLQCTLKSKGSLGSHYAAMYLKVKR